MNSLAYGPVIISVAIHWEFNSSGRTLLMKQTYYSIQFSTLGEAKVQTRGKPKSHVGVRDHSCQGFMVSLVLSVSLKSLNAGARLKSSIQVMDVLLA